MSKRTRSLLILAAVFVLGGAAGAGATYAIAVRGLYAKMHHPPHKARAKFRVEAMRRRLDLTADQVARLEAIYEEMGPEKEAAIRDCRPGLSEVRERTIAKIDEVLTPEQREKHAAMRERMRKYKRRSKPGGSDSAAAPSP